jgi:hypothetical protein
MFPEQGAGQWFYLNFLKQTYDMWVRTSSLMLEQMMQAPAFAAHLGKAFEQSLDIKRQTDEAWDIWLRNMRFATQSDIQTLLGAQRSLETKLTTAVGVSTVDPGRASEQSTQALEASLKSLRAAIQSDMESLRTELQMIEDKLTQSSASPDRQTSGVSTGMPQADSNTHQLE